MASLITQQKEEIHAFLLKETFLRIDWIKRLLKLTASISPQYMLTSSLGKHRDDSLKIENLSFYFLIRFVISIRKKYV